MSKKSLIIPLAVLVAAAILLFGIAGHLTGWQGNRPDQVTDDAYLRADMRPLSTRISGTVRKVTVNDYQSVKATQTLIELDDEDYRAALNQAQAALAASEASLADNQAAKRIQDAEIDAAKAGIVQAEAATDAAKAGIASVSPELDRALTELHRQQSLFDSKAATHQQLEAATAQQGQLSGIVAARKSFFIEHLSWHWIFWNGTILTPIMIALIHFGIPWQPIPKPQPGHPAPNWRGFLYASLGAALLYTALDQGQRLDWFHSPLIFGLVASGTLLIVAAIAERIAGL